MRRQKNSPDVQDEAVVVQETGLGPSQMKVFTGSSTFLLDQPIFVGGPGSGPNPYDLLSAALAASAITTMRVYASGKHWPVDAIRLRVVRRAPTAASRETFLRQILLIGALDPCQRAELLEISTRCPVFVSIGRCIDVQTVLLASKRQEEPAISCGEHMRDVMRAFQFSSCDGR